MQLVAVNVHSGNNWLFRPSVNTGKRFILRKGFSESERQKKNYLSSNCRRLQEDFVESYLSVEIPQFIFHSTLLHRTEITDKINLNIRRSIRTGERERDGIRTHWLCAFNQFISANLSVRKSRRHLSSVDTWESYRIDIYMKQNTLDTPSITRFMELARTKNSPSI